MKSVLVIINPCAGKNSKRLNTGEIIKAFRKRDIECFEKTTTCCGDATEIAKKYASSYDAIVCCGGDGTYNEVINGMMQAEVRSPIIYLPYGSTNDFANTMGITKDPDEAAQMYVDNMLNAFDVGKFNDRYFSYIASFGLATELSYNTPQRVKNLLGHSAYIINGFVLHLIPMLANLKPAHMVIEHDGETIEDDFYFGVIGNTNEVSGIFKLDKCNVKLNDGLLEVLLIRGASALAAPSIFFHMLRQNYEDDRILFFKTDKLKITSFDEVPWTLDGEYGGTPKELEIEVQPRAISVVSPSDSKFLL